MSLRPRIRSLKPELWQDERLSDVSRDARLLYVGLVTQADDEGRQSGNLALLRSRVFPFDADRLPLDDLDKWLVELADAGIVERYEVDGRAYVAIVSWGDDQKIDRPTASRLPEPPRESSSSPREDSTRAPAGSDQDQDQDRDREPSRASARAAGIAEGIQPLTGRASSRGQQAGMDAARQFIADASRLEAA